MPKVLRMNVRNIRLSVFDSVSASEIPRALVVFCYRSMADAPMCDHARGALRLENGVIAGEQGRDHKGGYRSQINKYAEAGWVPQILVDV